MSKLSKLIHEPMTFFRDFFDNRLEISSRKYSKKNIVNLVINKIDDTEEYQYFYYCGESLSSGQHHLNSWLPILNHYEITKNIKFILVIRNKKLFDWVVDNHVCKNAIYARRAVDVESVLKCFPNINLAIYSSASINNGHLIRFNYIKHVFIGHGDSEKAGSAHKGLRWFDEIWTSGQAHIDRFLNLKHVNFRGLEFVKIGRPSLKKLLISGERYTTPSRNNEQFKIAYFPTWEGVFTAHQYLSVPFAKDIANIVLAMHCQLDIKFHPYTGGRDNTYIEFMNDLTLDAKKNDALNIVGNINIIEIIDKYDLFICDISSVVTECLSVNRPIFLYLPSGVEIDLAISNMEFSQYCYVFSSVEELKNLLTKVLSGIDEKKEARQKAMDYFIGIDETKNDQMSVCLLNRK